MYSALSAARFSALGAGLPAFGVIARAQAGGAAAEMHMCVLGIYLPYLFGHRWICIYNVSDRPFSVGDRTLEPGGMISVSVHAGNGMEFNKEMRLFSGRNVTALKTTLDEDGLRRAANEIMSGEWNRYAMFSHNCTHFTAAVWKAATGERFNTFIFPFILKSQLPSDRTVSLHI